jgi:hypothetical protein
MLDLCVKLYFLYVIVCREWKLGITPSVSFYLHVTSKTKWRLYFFPLEYYQQGFITRTAADNGVSVAVLVMNRC